MDYHIIDKTVQLLEERRDYICGLLKKGNYEVADANEAVHKKFPLRATGLKALRVACIMDRFSYDSYKPECQLRQLTPEHWQQEIEEFLPDLLFIESAWQGQDKLWHRKVDRGSKEIFELTSYCQQKEIPIVFWNKEDPVYTDSFMTTARMADVIFTTDIDCVEKYKAELRHDRVYHLHFAAQPKIHNPIEKFERKDKFCFAGAYYHRYKKRAEVFDRFSDVFIRTHGFDIFDRNYQSALPEHAFPERYNQYILGKLDPSEIDIAYKGYRYGVNMNSIQQSQTMFARRAFEMLASNTITVGNFSRGIKNYFGDLTISTDDAETLEKTLAFYCANDITAKKYRLLGLRKVLSEHLYEDRLNYIVQKVFGKSLLVNQPVVGVLAYCETAEQAQRVRWMFERQKYEQCQLVLIGQPTGKETDKVRFLSIQQAENLLCANFEADFYACMDPHDYYGEYYLTDLVLTLRYGQYEGVGKVRYALMQNQEVVWKDGGTPYTNTSELSAARSILSRALLADKTLAQVSRGGQFEGEHLFGIDEFQYCQGCQNESCAEVDDLVISDQGLSLRDIERTAENIKSQVSVPGLVITADEVIKQSSPPPGVQYRMNGSLMNIESELPQQEFRYIMMNKRYEVAPHLIDGKLPVRFRLSGSLEMICTCIFYDIKGRKLSPAYPRPNTRVELEVPPQAYYIEIGLRLRGMGQGVLQDISMGEIAARGGQSVLLTRSDVLVVTNHYPQQDQLYRNMFVHKRMLCYKQAGHVFDVMRINLYANPGFREFDGINVMEGHAEQLALALEKGKIHTVCVHFLDETMWEVLKHYLENIKLIVWVHGAEIQPWWRREYNFVTEKDLKEGKAASVLRQAFWKEVFETAKRKDSIHFIFVSQYFADEVMEDNNITLRPEQYSIIHNCIDTDMFQYIPKAAEQRKKILSIKPYASRKYANDITMNAIVALSKVPCFKDMEFTLYGSGIRFEEDTAALRKYKNVHLHKQFLSQDKIAELHKGHGVFIATTRMDAQGVSRDEAMSSGLVPIASNVAAIPEFVDENCGILVPGEDPQAVADAIKRLYEDPKLFLRLSEGAAERVRSQTSRPYTIDRELQLILDC